MVKDILSGFKIIIFLTAISGVFSYTATAAGGVPRINKEELRVLIDYTDVTILDVRTDRDWKAIGFKIKTAIRENPENFKSWANKYPKDETVVLYCARSNEATSAGLAKKLMDKGYKKVYALKGGWREWFQVKYPVEKK